MATCRPMSFTAFASLARTSCLSSFAAVSVISVGLGLVSACGTATFIVQQYDGSPLAEQQVAILRLNGNDPVRLEALDGEPLGYELHDRASRVHIEMLPGEHELALAEGPELPAKRRRFRAEAGKVYRPLLVRTATDAPVIPGVTGWVVGIYEVNAGNDEIIREISQIKLPQTTPAAAPAPIPSVAPTASFAPVAATASPAPIAPPSASAPVVAPVPSAPTTPAAP